MAYTTWIPSPDVWGPQKSGPSAGGPDDTQYPNCGFQRIYPLEDILYGLEFVITPILQQIQAAGALTEISETQNLTLTGGTDNLPGYGGAGTLYKISIYNLSTNANANVRTSGGADFTLEPGVSMDLYTSDPTTTTATGTAGDVIQLIYTAKQ